MIKIAETNGHPGIEVAHLTDPIELDGQTYMAEVTYIAHGLPAAAYYYATFDDAICAVAYNVYGYGEKITGGVHHEDIYPVKAAPYEPPKFVHSDTGEAVGEDDPVAVTEAAYAAAQFHVEAP